MLKTRVVTAVVLLFVFLSALFGLPPAGWVGFVTLVAAIGAWEWGALLSFDGRRRVALGIGFAVLCLAIVFSQPAALGLEAVSNEAGRQFGQWLYLPAIAFWALLVPLWMMRRWPLPKTWLGVLPGLLVLLPTWLALIQLRQMGGWALLGVMAIVWIADIAAYFSGRRFGRRKIAPTISPGKTWEGAIGAAFAVVLYGLVLSRFLPHMAAAHDAVLVMAFLGLTAVSIIGDLFESLLKRQAGLKDSSAILPGHGGVLDRIDSLTSTLPLVAFFWLMRWN